MHMLKVLLAAATIAAALSGCAGPRIVRSMTTTREGKFRLLYDRNAGWGKFEQGLIDCKSADNGAITDCHSVNVAFREE